jgi:hypothetical protein
MKSAKLNKKVKVNLLKIKIARTEHHFSIRQMIIVALVFAAIGVYFIWQGFAAGSPIKTVEGELMVLPVEATSVIDTTASSGKAAYFQKDSTATQTFDLVANASQIVVRAKGAQCSGAPEMTLVLDGTPLQTYVVSSTNWTDYTHSKNIASGSHTLSLTYSRDLDDYAGNSKNLKCSRDLYVDVTNFYGSAPAPDPAPLVNLTPDPTSVVAGGSITLTWSSTYATSCAASNSTGIANWSGSKATSGSAPVGPVSATTTFTLQCTGSGGTSTKSTQVTVATSGGGSVLFEDQFNAPAGTVADSTKWTDRGSSCEGFLGQAGSRAANTFHDGAGNLVIRTKRESGYVPASGCATHYYSTGLISNFSYGSGWPASGVKTSWPVPFRVELRAQYPALTGGWGGGWLMNTDRARVEKITEVDFSEMRTFSPTVHQGHQHVWYQGPTDANVHDISSWSCTAPTSGTSYNMTTAHHIYSADVYSDRIVYKVDGITCGTRTEQVLGRFGAILNFGIGDPNTWGSGYTSGPPSSDPGPWDTKFDYIRVTAL